MLIKHVCVNRQKDDVPTEVLRTIFSFLEAAAVTRCYKVCKEWAQVLRSADSSFLWLAMLTRDFSAVLDSEKVNKSEKEGTLPQLYWYMYKQHAVLNSNVQSLEQMRNNRTLPALYLTPAPVEK
jgi:hypothetical protein